MVPWFTFGTLLKYFSITSGSKYDVNMTFSLGIISILCMRVLTRNLEIYWKPSEFWSRFADWVKFTTHTGQEKKFSIKDFFSKCDQICRFLRIWSYLQKKSLMRGYKWIRLVHPTSQNKWPPSVLHFYPKQNLNNYLYNTPF